MDADLPPDPLLTDAIGRLRDTGPAADLWPGIASQLAPRRPRGTLLLRWPVALAAGLVLVVATSAGTALVLRHSRNEPATADAAQAGVATAAMVTASFAPGDAALARAIDDLERVVRSSVDRLDPAARLSVHQSLVALDAAIAQAAARQTAAPGDPAAGRYLTSTLRKKLQLLRTVSELAQQS